MIQHSAIRPHHFRIRRTRRSPTLEGCEWIRSSSARCAAFHKRTGRIIKLLTVQEILDEEHVQKDVRSQIRHAVG
jgi:hypothetical protein